MSAHTPPPQPKLTKAQEAVLRVLAIGPTRVGSRTATSQLGEARTVSQAVWAFTHGQHRKAGLVEIHPGDDGEDWAQLTPAGKAVVEYFS